MQTRNIVIALSIALLYIAYRFAYSPPLSVTLDAKSWNEGKVHIWNSLHESSATFIDLPDGTLCEQVDGKTHRLIGPPPPIYYYHVDCDGVIGYVEVDQVR